MIEVLTAIYVLATLVIVGVMMHSNRLTRQSINTMVELERERTRPNVILDMESFKFSPHLVLTNIGQTPAYDLTIDITPEIKAVRGVVGKEPVKDDQWVDIPLLVHGVAFLPPGKVVTAFIAPLRELRRICPALVFTGSVRYKDQGGNERTDPIHIDLNHLGPKHIEKDVGEELEKLTAVIAKIESAKGTHL